MKSSPIANPTRRLGAPKNWNHETEGICHTLEILDQDGWMISAWDLSPEERERVAAGARVVLFVQGVNHPVVSLAVEEKTK